MLGTGDFNDGNVTWKHGILILLWEIILSNNVSGSFNVAIVDSAGEKISHHGITLPLETIHWQIIQMEAIILLWISGAIFSDR